MVEHRTSTSEGCRFESCLANPTNQAACSLGRPPASRVLGDVLHLLQQAVAALRRVGVAGGAILDLVEVALRELEAGHAARKRGQAAGLDAGEPR